MFVHFPSCKQIIPQVFPLMPAVGTFTRSTRMTGGGKPHGVTVEARLVPAHSILPEPVAATHPENMVESW